MTCWKSLSKFSARPLLVLAIVETVYHKAGTPADQRILPALPLALVFTRNSKGRQVTVQHIKESKIMNVYINNLKLSPKQVNAIRAAIKARYTPARVKALNAKLQDTEGK